MFKTKLLFQAIYLLSLLALPLLSWAQGQSCDDPYIITTLPFNETNLSNCGFGNNYENELDACGSNSNFTEGEDMVFQFTPNTTACYNIQAYDVSDFDLGLGIFIFEGCPTDNGTCITSEGDYGVLSSPAPFIKIDLTANTNYYIIISNDVIFWNDNECNQFSLYISNPADAPPNDDCVDATTLTGLGSNYNATACNEPSDWAPDAGNWGTPKCGGGGWWTYNHNGVWYTFNNATQQDVTIDIFNIVCEGYGENDNTLQIGVWSNSGTCDLNQESFHGCLVTDGDASLLLKDLPEGDFYLFVDGNGGALCNWEFASEEVICNPPIIYSDFVSSECAITPITLTVDSIQSDVSYTIDWLENGVSMGISDMSNEVNPSETTTYTIQVTSECGSSSFDFLVNLTDNITASIGGDAILCTASDTANLNVNFTGTGPWSFQYTIDGELQFPIYNITDNPYILSTSQLGTYTLTEVRSGDCAGMVSGEANISLFDAVAATFEYDTTVFCLYSANPTPDIILAGGIFGTNNMDLQINPQTGEIDVSTAEVGETYAVSYETLGECPTLKTVNLTAAGIQLDGFEDIEIMAGESVDLDFTPIETSNQNLIYTYQPTNGLNCTDCPTPTASPTETTTYEVTVTNGDGCMATTNITINVTPDNMEEEPDNPNDDEPNEPEDVLKLVTLPNAFSPNEDGMNDFFRLSNPTDDIQSASIKIYNRWGNVVFESIDFHNHKGWNGVYKFENVDIGSYSYFLSIQFKDDTSQQFQGSISLVR